MLTGRPSINCNFLLGRECSKLHESGVYVSVDCRIKETDLNFEKNQDQWFLIYGLRNLLIVKRLNNVFPSEHVENVFCLDPRNCTMPTFPYV